MLLMPMMRPQPPLHHVLGRGLRAEEDRAGVDVQRPVPAFELLLERRLDHARRGVAHEDIHPAERLRGRGDEPLHSLDLAHVRLNHDRLAAGKFDFGGRLLGLGLVAEVVDGHIGAVPRQLQRDGAADPAAAAGDDRGLAAQYVK